jgi:aminoglycoside phosphotransferase family enzyme/predicted kinase
MPMLALTSSTSASACEATLEIEALRRHLQARSPGSPVQLIETHISWVLLSSEFAYKLKKPVKLGFLDFSTPQLRQRFCDEELRLNRRLAPNLYIDVVPVTGTTDAPEFGPGPAIDHAVRMRRFPAGSLFSERLAAGRLESTHVDALAQRVADFHLAAPVAGEAMPYGTPQAIHSAAMQLLVRLEAHEGADTLRPLRRWLEEAALRLAPTWESRRRTGWVRECHGDLHLANAAMYDGDVIAFDCIEFDPALRWIDVMSDVAFIVMDLMAHERRDLAFRFLDVWLTQTGDHAGLAVLRHGLVYRALVRALVARLRPAGSASGPDYLALARRLAAPGDARLALMHGLSGSGKTFWSQRLLERVAAVRLRSDVERKRLFGLKAEQRSADVVPEGIYTPEATERTFATLRERAALSLRAGWPTIVDATFLRQHERTAFERVARDLDVPFAILHCHAPAPELRRRIRHRRMHGHDASEADLAVLEEQLARQEPLDEAQMQQVVDIDTGEPVDIATVEQRWYALTQG